MKTTRNMLAVVMMIAVIGLAGTSRAALVAADINTGGADTGFSGGWVGSRNRMPVLAPDLTYANYAITQTGSPTYVYGGDTNGHTDRMDSRNLAAAMSGEIWFSALVNAGRQFAGLSFDSNAATSGADTYSHALSELRVLMTPSQLIVDMGGGSLPSGTGSFAAGTHLILGQMNVAAGNDTILVWVDPDVNAALPAPDFTSTTVHFADSIARIGVPNVGGGATGDIIDAIRMSDTATAFRDVTGVDPFQEDDGVIPEPMTMLAVGLSVAGLGGYVRKRRKA